MYVDFNITNFCNAKCPTCKRFSQADYLKLADNFKVVHMDFDNFKSVLDQNIDYFKNKCCFFCGEFGDPLMHPQILQFSHEANKIFRYVQVFTNGGLRRDEFFNYLIKTKNDIRIVFGIDGLTQETNNKYRINVNTKLAFDNMLFLVEYDKARWDYTIFEHNIHEVEDVIKMAKQYNIELLLRLNTRNNFFGINKISQKQFEYIKNLSKEYINVPRLRFDLAWFYNNDPKIRFDLIW